jgi:diguanylate cyclase (GGDEF)-like protein/PAS domain S-box-containing protein
MDQVPSSSPEGDSSPAVVLAHPTRRVAGALALLYALLLPTYLITLAGPARWVMGAVASLSILVALLVCRRAGSNDLRPLVLVVTLPIINPLAHLAVTGDPAQTAPLLLTAVGIAAVIPQRRGAATLIGTELLGWALVSVGIGMSGSAMLHWAIRLAMATMLAAVLQLVWQGRERRWANNNEVTRRHAAELEVARASLVQSEQRFRSVFEESPVGVALADEQGLFVTANRALCRMLEREETELIGHSSLQFTHPDDAPDHSRAQQLLDEADDGIARLEKRYLRPSGEIRWAWLTIARVDGPQGQDWTLAHIQDVTDRKLAEQQLADSEANLAAVAQVARRIRTGDDPRQVILEAARDLAEARSSVLLELDLAGALTVTGALGMDLQGLALPAGEPSLTAHVMTTAQPLFVADPANHPLVSSQLLAASGAQSIFLQPLISHGRVTGVLVIVWDSPRSGLSDRTVRAAELLADEAALAIDHQALLSRLEQQATTDTLTGLPNRRAWDHAVSAMLTSAGVTGRPVTVALADLDHFKAYNDSHGHAAGDELLRTFASLGGAVLRSGDLLARWGGEEFVIALPDCDTRSARAVLDRLRMAVPHEQTCSVGVAAWDGRESVHELLARADAALYEAKNNGRDQIVTARPMRSRRIGIPAQSHESPPASERQALI